MTDFDYPPTREFTLAAALDSVEADLEDARDHVSELEDDEDAKRSELADARSDVQSLESKRDGLQWAVGQFGSDAAVALEAFTATSRARTIDKINRKTVGAVGGEETRIWLLAAALDEAPWLQGDEDLVEAKSITGELPPAVQDYLDDELQDVNDLSEGNS